MFIPLSEAVMQSFNMVFMTTKGKNGYERGKIKEGGFIENSQNIVYKNPKPLSEYIQELFFLVS